ncbi:hypothetical protein Cni_G11111 [Canna indica]|uniref:Uncharacterized protein n=1 Tax=Canna indica TaxID=4628 RepID=A0AAQ3K5G8_9LILI|nr:hypothetical protein Cni_G11111 [Canna indica]
MMVGSLTARPARDSAIRGGACTGKASNYSPCKGFAVCRIKIQISLISVLVVAAMVGKRVWFTKLNKEHHWPPWKLRLTFLDDLSFHVLYFLEAVILVTGLCCFFLCCGCHL